MTWLERLSAAAALIVWGLDAGAASAQSGQPLPAPSKTPAAAPRAELVPAPPPWARRARVRTRRAPVAPSNLPAPDSELAKAFTNPKPALPHPTAPQQPLGTLMLQPRAGSASTPAPYSTKININRSTLQQLQTLPGVGASMGAHIMARRPYRNLGDLGRAGVPLDTIQSIAPLITMEP